MASKYDTCFFERYAKVSLEVILGDKFRGLMNADRPDLQDVEHSIGIEVTRAMPENKMAEQSLVNEMAAHKIFDVSDDDAAEISRTGYAYGIGSNNLVGTIEKDYWRLAQPLKRIVASKIGKVSDGFYGRFNEFGLYVFSKDDLNFEAIETLVRYVHDLQKWKHLRYQSLYISQIQEFYACNLKTNEILKYEITPLMCRYFYRQALIN